MALRLMMAPIILLSDLSCSLGIIGITEWYERAEIAEWLSDNNASIKDPREPFRHFEERERPNDESHLVNAGSANSSANASSQSTYGKDDQNWIKFVVLSKWHFTLGDVDCVPSVPHGHENAKTQAWPKLNPYTGRVFNAMHQEDISKRLDRTEMRLMWRNEESWNDVGVKSFGTLKTFHPIRSHMPGAEYFVSLGGDVKPNLSVNRTACKLRVQVPSGLRPLAAGYLKRYAKEPAPFHRGGLS